MILKNKLRALVAVVSTGAMGILLAALMQTNAFAATGTYYKWTGTDSGSAGLGGCSLNCWSVAGNWDVSTDGGSTYTTASTAPQSSDNSGAGDNLVFDNSSLGATTTVNDDISGLVVDTITSQGTGVPPDYFTLAGDAISLTNGFLGTVNDVPYLAIGNAITFNTSQTYGQAGVSSSEYALNGALTIPGGVTLTAASPIYIQSVAGGGSLVLAGPTSGEYAYYHSIVQASTLSGSIEIQSGAQLDVQTPSDLGTAAITIDNGAQLSIADTATTSTDTLTIPNAITLGGNGGGVSEQNQGAIIASLYDSTTSTNGTALTVNLTGAVTLTGDTGLASVYPTDVTYNFTGPLTEAGHTFSAVAASQPTYGTTTVEVNGVAVAGAGATAAAVKAPKTPDTGSALISASAILPLVGGISAAIGVYIISRRVKNSYAKQH